MIGSCEATGPMAMVWLRWVGPVTLRYLLRFSIDPCQTRKSAPTIESGTRT
jgi:hypothetical protein